MERNNYFFEEGEIEGVKSERASIIKIIKNMPTLETFKGKKPSFKYIDKDELLNKLKKKNNAN